MKILLIGEYSRLHNSLKEGLIALNHDVTLVGNGDGFKNYPVDINIDARFFRKPFFFLLAKILHKLTNISLIELECAYKFNRILPSLKGYDVVQLINENSIKTNPFSKPVNLFLNREKETCYFLLLLSLYSNPDP